MPDLQPAIRWGLGLGTALALILWYFGASMLIRAPMSPNAPPASVPTVVAVLDTVAFLAAPVLLVAVGVVGTRQARPRSLREALGLGALAGLAASVPVYVFGVSPGVTIGVGVVPLLPATPLVDPQPTAEAAAQLLKDVVLGALWAAPLMTLGTGTALGVIGAVCGAAYHLVASRLRRKVAAPQPASST